MSNINNTSTTLNRNSALSINELALKSWYSNLHVSSASSKNRISPIAANKSTLQQEPSSPSLSHLFRKIARTPTRTLSRSSTTMSHASWKKHQQSVHIYLKSPHVVASGELAGSIVILGDTTLVHKMKSIHVDLVGLEVVHDPSKTNQKSYSFLDLSVLQLTGPEQVTPYHVSSAKATEETHKIIVPFLVSLPSDLSGTYVDKKGSIQYYLKSEIQWHADKPTWHQQSVTVYSNMMLKSLKDATDLYAPVMLHNKQIWKTTREGHVSVETSMPRSLWMSGAPIYVTVKMHNAMLSDTVRDIKLELLRKQNTYSIHPLNQSLVPVTSSCEILVTTCLADLGWWKPLEPASQDQVILTIDTPPNQVTVRHQKLIDVSFSIRLSIQSVLNANTVVSDIPVMLVHPISMDPPPGNYTKSVPTTNTEECHLILQQAVTKIATTQFTPSVSSTPSLVSCCTESDSTSRPLSEMHVPATTTTKKFTSMKKSLSKWGLQLSRKMSISSDIHSHNESSGKQPSNATEKTIRLRISSPLISSSSSASSLHSSVCSKSSNTLQSVQANEEITSIIKNKELQAQQQEENPEKSIMRFGQIVGPKRFGQQPGCLGDAGLDIRNCFNVATATEAIQCYAAEKVEIPHPDDNEEEGNYYILPPYLEPIQFSELVKMKVRIMAPHTEKCQIDPDMMSKRQIQQYEQDHYGASHQEEEEEEEEDALTELPQDLDQQQQQQHGNSTKRMLASSRHLRNVQRKSVQVSRDGRALLTFSK